MISRSLGGQENRFLVLSPCSVQSEQDSRMSLHRANGRVLKPRRGQSSPNNSGGQKGNPCPSGAQCGALPAQNIIKLMEHWPREEIFAFSHYTFPVSAAVDVGTRSFHADGKSLQKQLEDYA